MGQSVKLNVGFIILSFLFGYRSTTGEVENIRTHAIHPGTDEHDTDAGGESLASELTRDDVHGILSSHRRRYTLHHLKQNGTHTELGTLSERIAAWENDIPVSQVTSVERRRVYTSLQQCHLPKLDRSEVVNYDRRAGTVELSSRASDLDLYLDVGNRRDISWSQYYLGLAAFDVALVAAVAAETYSLTLVPDIVWMVFLAAALALSAIVHSYSRTGMYLGGEGPPPELRE